MLRSMVKTLSAMLAGSALLAACGGGSDANSVAANAVVQSGGKEAGTPAQSGTGASGSNNPASQDNAGVPFPTTVISSVFDSTNAGQPLTVLLQDDGSYFIVYSDTDNRKPSGVRLGTGTMSNGSFVSSNGLDLTLVGIGGQTPLAFSLSASYSAKNKFDGNISYAADNKTVSFASGYNSAFEKLPNLADFAGIYVGSIANKDFREENIILMISADGKLSGHLICGCMINAQLRVQDDGTAYAATLDFKQGFHVLTGKSLGGNVYLDGKNNRLYIVGKMTGTEDRVIFVGTKV